MTLRVSIYSLLLPCCVLLLGCSSSKKAQQPSDKKSASTNQVEVYSNATYNVEFKAPKSWILVEESQLKVGDWAINIFSKGTGAEEQLPLNVHAKPQHSYITIWPKGLGTELPAGRRSPIQSTEHPPDFSFDIDTSKSTALQLNNGKTWGYFIVPQRPPRNWSDDGFIFSQIQVRNQQSNCFDEKTGKKLPMKECDSLEGDQLVRKGDLNEQDATIIRNVLGSLSLKEIKKKEAAEDMINIQKPAPNMDINSPLYIKGEAKGYWYFEGSFSIKLYDAADNLLADTVARAQDDWTTESFVPFEATLNFNAPDDERGKLVFERANPSGLPQNDQSYSQPVIFPPKK